MSESKNRTCPPVRTTDPSYTLLNRDIRGRRWQVLWWPKHFWRSGWWPRNTLRIFRYWELGPLEVRRIEDPTRVDEGESEYPLDLGDAQGGNPVGFIVETQVVNGEWIACRESRQQVFSTASRAPSVFGRHEDAKQFSKRVREECKRKKIGVRAVRVRRVRGVGFVSPISILKVPCQKAQGEKICGRLPTRPCYIKGFQVFVCAEHLIG